MIVEKNACEFGLTSNEVDAVLHQNGMTRNEFNAWMSGQTMMLCNGEIYNHESNQYEIACSEAHGVVVYTWDMERYLDGLPVID